MREAGAGLRTATRTLHDLILQPREIPAVLAEPWQAWRDCRRITDPTRLAEDALKAAVTLTDACAIVAGAAREEPAARDDRRHTVVGLLAEWTKLSRDAGTPGRRDAGTPGRRDAVTP